MPDPKLYISVLNDGTNDLYIKDAEARQDIEDLKGSVTGAMHFVGTTTSVLSDGATTKPIVIDGENYNQNAGDVAIYGELEFAWNGSKWQEFGSTGSLKALAFKDSATGSVTASGSNAASSVSFSGTTDGDFVTGFETDPVLPSFTEGTFSAGSLPSFTEGTFTQGTLPSFSEGTFSQGTLPSFTEGTFTQGTLPSMTYDSANEKLTFSAGTLPTKAADSFSAGTLPSKEADTWSAGTLPTKAADTFSAGTLPSKDADTFSAGTAPTLATDKAITDLGTAEAAAQTFTGSAVSVTVS